MYIYIYIHILCIYVLHMYERERERETELDWVRGSGGLESVRQRAAARAAPGGRVVITMRGYDQL